MDKLTGFFIGCSSPEGFTAYLDELYNPHKNGFAYIIKGGAGTGKSTLMKKIYYILTDKGIPSECIFCSSDPDSLDAIIVPELCCCVADGTNPHAIEPKYYGVCEEIINLGDYLDKAQLKEKKEQIIELSDLNKSQHKNCEKLLQGAAVAQEEIKRIVVPLLNSDLIKEAARKIIEKEFKNPKAQKGKQIHRFISAPTSKGLYFNKEAVLKLCSRFYILDDNFSCFAPSFLSLIGRYALNCGFDIISSPNPLSNKKDLEHILIPQLKLGFLTSSKLNKIELENSKSINISKFIDREAYKKSANKIRFYLKARDEFIEDSLKALKSSKISHDKLESMYMGAMDFSCIDSLALDICDKMLKNLS